MSFNHGLFRRVSQKSKDCLGSQATVFRSRVTNTPESSSSLHKSEKSQLRSSPQKKLRTSEYPGKEKSDPNCAFIESAETMWSEDDLSLDEICGLDFIEPTLYYTSTAELESGIDESRNGHFVEEQKANVGYHSNSIESKLVNVLTKDRNSSKFGHEDHRSFNFEESHMFFCPLCGVDLSNLSEQARMLHINDCLDSEERRTLPKDAQAPDPPEVVDDPTRVAPVVEWLRGKGLERYEDAFVREEVDWDALQWLTEEDLIRMGMTAIGPRKKIVHAIAGLRTRHNSAGDTNMEPLVAGITENKRRSDENRTEMMANECATKMKENKRITDYFTGPQTAKKNTNCVILDQKTVEKFQKKSAGGGARGSIAVNRRKPKDIPLWCRIPGTPFLVVPSLIYDF